MKERTASDTTPPLLEAIDLRKHFPIRAGLLRREVGAIQAVAGVSLRIHAGETVGLVGESGSGKSTLGRLLLHLLGPTSGRVLLDGRPLDDLAPDALRRARRDMQLVFQDPYASLNPRHTVGRIVAEPLEVHGLGTPAVRRARVDELLERVGLDPSLATRHPYAFSGGQRQRVGIARALATRPRLLVADEPISALDVSVQAQVVNLLGDLREELGLTLLFIAHDLAMVRHLCERVVVMLLGTVVEEGPTAEVFRRPLHPYTKALIEAAPLPDPSVRASGPPPLEGELPDPAAPPPGCRFHTRCPFATERCRVEVPALRGPEVEAAELVPELRVPGNEDRRIVEYGNRRVACHHAEEIASGRRTPT